MNKLYDLKVKMRKGIEKAKREIAVTALNHYKDKFKEGNGNWEGKQWPIPKRKTYGRSSRERSRTPLVKTGTLSRSLKYRISGDKIIFTSNVPYAGVHNYGLRSGRGAGFRMPQRRFVGMERVLKIKIGRILNDFLLK